MAETDLRMTYQRPGMLPQDGPNMIDTAADGADGPFMAEADLTVTVDEDLLVVDGPGEVACVPAASARCVPAEGAGHIHAGAPGHAPAGRAGRKG